MDFLEYQRVIDSLKQLDVTAHTSGEDEKETLELRIDDDEDRRIIVIGPNATTDIVEGAHAAVDPHCSLADAAESVLGLLHANESIVIPVRRWREVLDVSAFELAKHERWLDIDSEATLHQNTRDPLAILPADKHLVGALITACVEHGEDSSSNLLVTILDAPVVIEARHSGYLIVQCSTQPVMDNIVTGFSRS